MTDDDLELPSTAGAPSPIARQGRPLPSRRTISRKSLAAQVADTLRAMILTGEITFDTRITQAEIARLLDVSTMPVREALLRLTAEGFLVAAPNRSFTVRAITESDIRDIYWAHAVLSGEFTRRACLNADDALIQRLRDCEEAFAEAAHRADGEAMDAANWRFHREINLAAKSPKLWMLLEATLRYIPTSFYVLVPAWADESERGHEETLQAFERRDADGARAAAEAHVRAAGELLISSFWTEDSWGTAVPETVTKGRNA